MTTRLPDPTDISRPSYRPEALQGSFVPAAGKAELAFADFTQHAADLAAKEASKLDGLQAENALNQLRSRELEMTAGPDGFSQFKGGDALNNNLIDTYTQRYTSAIDEIASTLKNPKQQAEFRTKAAASAIGFKRSLYTYTADQANHYDSEVLSGTSATERQAAEVNWNDPAAVADSHARITHTVDLFAERHGLPPEEAGRLRLAALSPMHDGVATQAVANGQFDYAEKYIRDNKDEMSVDTMLRLSGEIQKQRGAALGVAAAQKVIQGVQATTQPTDFTRLANARDMVESGGKDFNADGSPVTSSTGAKYRGQVLPSTASNPGLGITPAKNDSPAEYNRVANEYLAALLQRYDGDQNKALAAYNVGFGAVDKAIKIAEKSQKKDMSPPRSLTDLTDPKATVMKSDVEAAAGPQTPTDWFSVLTDTSGQGASGILPPDQAKQVAAYVPKVLALYSAGGGVAPQPTIADVRRSVAAQLPGQPQSVVDAAQARAERDYNDLLQARKQQQEDAVAQALPLIQSGQVTSLDQLPPAMRQQIGTAAPQVQKFINASSKAADEALKWSPVATDFYYALSSDTEKLKSTPTADLLGLAPEIGRARALELVDTKNKITNDFDAETSLTFDRELTAQTAQAFGYKSDTPAQRRALIPIMDRAKSALAGAQAQTGHKLTREEKRDVLNRMFVSVRTGSHRPWYSTSWFMPNATTEDTKRGFELQAPEQIQVPPDVRDQIIKAGAAAGITLTEAEIREEYVYQQVQKAYAK